MNKELVEKMRIGAMQLIEEKLQGVSIETIERNIHQLNDVFETCAAVASEHYGDKWVGIDDRLPHADSTGDRLSTDLYILCKDGQVIEGWMDYAFRRFENLQGVMVEPTHFIEKKRPIPQPPQQ